MFDIAFLSDSVALVSGNNGTLFKWNAKKAVFTDVRELKVESLELRVFPNPVRNKLQIKTEELKIENLKASISNALGEEVLSINLGSNISEIDVSALNSGIYFLTLSNQNVQKTVKFIKE